MAKIPYPLVISDYDGTLCASDKTVGAFTRATIARHRAAGGIFTVATGRMFEGLVSQLDRIGLDDDLLVSSYQGGFIATAQTHKVLYESKLDSALGARILRDALAQDGVVAQAYPGGRVLSTHRDARTEWYGRINCVEFEYTDELIARASDTPFYKILLQVPSERLSELYNAFSVLYAGECQVCCSSNTFLEFFPCASGKENALIRLADYYKIPIECTLAFGDQRNDLIMLCTAGRGIAVANAHPEVLAAADEVTLDNNHEGVAVAIARLNGYPAKEAL